MSKHFHRQFLKKIHYFAGKLRKHYVSVIALALAVMAIMWYLGFNEFQHSLAFLIFERVLHAATHWASVVEEA